MSEKSLGRIVDADHPWLGLTPFTEHTKEYFFGRDREIRDLFLRVREQPLTILYGQSGLGKTSLLGAGLIPKLAVEGYRPHLIRLGFEPTDDSAINQTLSLLWNSLGHHELSTDIRCKSIWEYFHYLPNRPVELEQYPPVLIFDQFEEIFTLTESKERQGETQEFFRQLADLIENRPPQTVQALLRETRSKAREYELGSSSVRVVITLREDYLSQLEVWKKLMPSLMRNRIGLRQLDGPQALEAVVRPGEHGGRRLVNDEVGATIVRFVAKRPPETPLEEIGAVPPLLSLLCDELNQSRLAANESEITAEQVQRQSGDILQNFYTRSFDHLPEAVRRYVEDRMVTVGGHRNPVAREDALSELTQVGVSDPRAAIDQLIVGRLLSSEERGGVQRLEVTHDVLAPLVVHSRDQRRVRERAEKAEREQVETRKQRVRIQLISGVLAALTLLSICAAGIAIRATLQAQAKEAEANLQAQLAQLATQDAEAARSIASEQENLAKTRLEEQIEQGKAASEVLFAYGLSEYDNNQLDKGVDKLTRAWRLRSDEDPLKVAYGRVLLDRLSRSGRSWIVLEHKNTVRSMMFSPDATRLATVADEVAQLWNPSTGSLVGKPMRHSSYHSVMFSPNSSTLATQFGDSVCLWNAESGELIGSPMQHAGSIEIVAFSPESSRLATISVCEERNGITANHARLWDTRTCTQLGQSMRIMGACSTIAFSPDGTQLTTISEFGACSWDTRSGAPLGNQMSEYQIGIFSLSPDNGYFARSSFESKTVDLWNVLTGAKVSKPIQHAGPVQAVAFTPSGLLATSSDTQVRFWDPTGVALGRPMRHSKEVHRLAFCPSGVRLATTSWDGVWGSGRDVSLWDLETCTMVGSVRRNVDFATFSPDGTRFVTISLYDNVATLWDSKSGTQLGDPMRHKGQVSFIAFSADSSQIATSDDRTVRLWDTQSDLEVGRLLRHAEVFDGAIPSPSGTRLATTSRDKTSRAFHLRLWDTESGSLVGKTMHHSSEFRRVIFSPDGSQLISTSCGPDRVCNAHIWNAKTGSPIQTIREVDRVSFTSDGTRMATVCEKTAKLWDVDSGLQLGETIRHSEEINFVIFSPDGTSLVTASNSTAKLWDTKSGVQLRQTIQQGEDTATAFMDFSPDGAQLIATLCGPDKICNTQVWNAQTGAPIKHIPRTDYVSFSNDGKQLVTMCGNSACLWDVKSGSQLSTKILEHGEKRDLRSVVFSPDGSRLVTIAGSEDHRVGETVHLWNAETGAMIGNPIPFSTFIGRKGYFFGADMTLITASEEGVRIWDLYTGASLGQTLKDVNKYYSVALDGKGSPVAVLWSEDRVCCSKLEIIKLANVNGLINRFVSKPGSAIPFDKEFLAEWKQREARLALRFRGSVAASAIEDKNWFAAEFHLPWLCEQEPENAKWKYMLSLTRCNQHAIDAEWPAALELARNAMDQQPNANNYRLVVLCSIASGNISQTEPAMEGYLSYAEKSSEASDWTDACATACLINDTQLPSEQLHSLASKAIASSEKTTLYREILGATLYRMGKSEEAEAELAKSIKVQSSSATIDVSSYSDPNSADAKPFLPANVNGVEAPTQEHELEPIFGSYFAHAFLALTYHQLNEPEKSAFEQRILATLESRTPPTSWEERLRRKLLGDEVRQTCVSETAKD